MELFAYRLYEAQRTADINIFAQRTPVVILCDEKQRYTMEQLFAKYEGFSPFIFGDKLNVNPNQVTTINTK